MLKVLNNQDLQKLNYIVTHIIMESNSDFIPYLLLQTMPMTKAEIADLNLFVPVWLVNLMLLLLVFHERK